MRDNNFPEKSIIIKTYIEKSERNHSLFMIKIVSLLFNLIENVGRKIKDPYDYKW
jgi:hypothetical protein